MPRGDPRLAPLPVRLTIEEKAQLKELATVRGETLSEAARAAIQVAYRINRHEVNRRQQAGVLSRLGEVLAELRRFGGLYALQAKSTRPVTVETQASLDVAIAATEQVMRGLLK